MECRWGNGQVGRFWWYDDAEDAVFNGLLRLLLFDWMFVFVRFFMGRSLKYDPKSNVIIFTYCFLFEDFWIYLYMDRYIPFISDPFWQRGNVWDGLNQSWSYKTRFPGFRFRTMELENGPPCRWLKSSSFQGPIFHFHDYGRKGMWSPFEGWDLIFAWHVLYCLLNISNNDWQLYTWQLFRFYLKATRNLEVISLPWSPRSCTEQ